MFIQIISGFFGGLVLGSFFEHSIHKYLLHSTPKFLMKNKYVKGMWETHSVSHHGHYLPDDHYTQDETNKEEVLAFSWYHGPLIISVSSLFVYGVTLFIPSNLFIVLGASIAFTLYYIAYEGLHSIMHVPKKWIWMRNT